MVSSNPEVVSELRSVLPLYFEEVHIVIRKDAKIKSLGDLKEKKVLIGRGLLDTNLAKGRVGYQFKIADGSEKKFAAVAIPIADKEKSKSFYIDQKGVVRWARGDRVPTVRSPEWRD